MSEPTQGGTLRVSLVGPQTGGKTQLLAALMAGTKSGAHGFPISLGLTCELNDDRLLRVQTHAERMKIILDDRRRTLAASGQVQATAPGTINQYEFQLSFRQDNFEKARAPITFVVADAAGEHAFPESPLVDDESDNPNPVRDQFLNLVAESTGVVIVVPLYRLGGRKFNERMETLIEALAPRNTPGSSLSPPPAFQRVAIALSQYERLFTDFAGDAAELATHPEVVRSVIRSRLREAPWMLRLRELDQSWGGSRDIRIVPTSAYGFLPDFGNPNIDAEAEDANSPFVSHEDAATKTREYERYPFLHADPFIFAATGHVNSYMTGIEDLYGRRPASAGMHRPAERAPPPRPGKTDIFDRISRHVSSFFEI